MKKTLIGICVALILMLGTMGAILGYHVKYQNEHIFVEDAVYEKSLTSLDLRGTGVSLEHYEAVRQQLPDCRIRFDLPFQGEYYPDDTAELTITSLTEEDIDLLEYLPQLKTVHAEDCEDYDVLMMLRERRPEIKVLYTVSIGGKDYPQNTDELFLESEQLDLQELSAAVEYLPKLQTIHFDHPTVPSEALISLRESWPDIDITWEMDAFGTTYRSDVTEIDLTGMQFASLDEVEEALAYFPDLEKVILSECGPEPKTWFDNETMAEFREKMRPQYKVVWTVKINNMRVRTDETYFMPNKYGEAVSNYQVQNLRYCEDMLCIDLGHQPIVDLSFLEGTPHLKYFICIDSPLIYIDPIRNCKELIYCELFWTVVSDYSPLLECTSLQDLNVCRTKGDPMFFKDMPWLKNLWITGYWMKPSDKEELSAALPDTFIKFSDNMMAGNGWRDLQNYFDMRDLLGMPYNRW